MQRLWAIYLITLAVLVAGCPGILCAAKPQSAKLPAGFEFRSHQDARGSHAYAVSIPEGKSPEKGWPIVLFLHGAGERGTDGLLPISVGLGTALEQSPEPFIAVFPQSESQQERYLRGWEAGLTDAKRALQILAEVEAAEPVDTSKRILCGWSMGGYGAWSLAAQQPEHWSAVLAISGGAIRELDLLSLAKSRTPVWAIHGTEDALIPAEQSEELISKLRAENGRGSLTLVSGVGHDVWRDVFAQPQVFAWMLNPDDVKPAQVDFKQYPPLPQRSKFYVEQFATVSTFPDSMSLRFGNAALSALAQTVPESIPATDLQGDLENIERTLSTGSDTFELKFSNLKWSCTLSDCQLRAISGGRFRARFGLKPITLTIGETTLQSNQVSASTSEISVVIGHQYPAVLDLEIQPVMIKGHLRFILLREHFEIADNNWFIRKPAHVEVRSDTFNEFHVVTGIVGGLYRQREELERQIKSVVPTLLSYLEQELQTRNAPKLASMLWPLPVLVPEVQLSPSQVRTDRKGISLVMDLKTVTYGPTVDGSRAEPVKQKQRHPFEVRQIPSSNDLVAALSLDSVEFLSQAVIQNQVAQINVLDMPGQEFHQLIEPEMLVKLFPELNSYDAVQAVLQLDGPFQIEHVTGEKDLLKLSAPKIAVTYLQRSGKEDFAPLGAFHFSLAHNLSLQLNSDHTPAMVELKWSPQAQMTGVRFQTSAEPPMDSKNTPAEIEQIFAKQFLTAWESWAQSQSHSTPAPSIATGANQLSLQALAIENNRIRLQFSTAPADADQTSQSR